MTHYKELVEEFRLEKFSETKEKFFFTAKALSKNFENEDGRCTLAKDSINKHLIWRHQHPVESGNFETHIYGKIVDAWLEGAEKEIFAKYEVYGHTEDHLKLREIIKERIKVGDPLGISMRYRKYFDDIVNEIVNHYDVLEHSGTPFPACSNCKSIDFEVIEMTNENENKEPELSKEDLDKSLEKIKDLEEQLNSKTKILEDAKLEMETLKEKMTVTDKELEKKKIDEQSLEDQVKDLRKEVEFLSTKKPILDKILEVKDLDERELEFLKAQDYAYLKGKYEDYSKEAVKPHVKSQEDSANESKDKMEEELEQKEVAFEQFTKLLNLKKKDK
ncbi:MAG: hypothetical protein V3V14_08310 [Saprospiraceae bacterium]